MSLTRARVSVTGVPSVGAWFVVTSRRDGHRTSGAPGLRVLGPDPRDSPSPRDMGRGCESSSRWGRGGWEPRRERGGGPGGNQDLRRPLSCAGTETRVTSETEQRGRAEASRTGYRENTVGERARVVYKVLLKSTICIHEIFLTKHWYFILFSSKILEIFVLKTFSLNCKIFNFKPRNILFSKQGCGKSGFNSS